MNIFVSSLGLCNFYPTTKNYRKRIINFLI